MARLGLDIDLALQRLLGLNKERAAANRGALEDRKRTKETAAQKADAASAASSTGSPTQNEEPRGGTLKRPKLQDPAAQRRKKGVEVYGVALTSKQPATGTQSSDSEGWTGYRLSYAYNYAPDPNVLIYSTTETYQGLNEYTLQDTVWKPEFNQELANTRRYWLSPAHTVTDHLVAFDWTFRQKSLGATGGFSNLEQQASIPALPIDLTEARVVDESVRYSNSADINRTFTSCDGTYIYHSRLIQVRDPLPVIFAGQQGLTDSLFDANNYETFKLTPVSRPGTEEEYQDAEAYSRRFIRNHPTYGDLLWRETAPTTDQGSYSLDTWLGLYWKFNARTKQPVSFRTGTVGFMENRAATAEKSAAAALFFTSMDTTDPVYRLWQSHRAAYSGYTDENLLNLWMQSDSFLGRWPAGLAFDTERSWLTLVTTTYGATNPRIFSKRVTSPPADYSSVPSVFLPPSYNEPLMTVEQYVANGWTHEGLIPQNAFAPLEQYFAFKP